MITPVYIQPGSIIPDWLIEMERVYFGNPWSSMYENEHIWAIPLVSFARWIVNREIQEAELLRICVAKNCFRKGYGRAILRHSQSQVANFRVNTMFLEVRASNIAARSLYESEGWSYLGLRAKYYNDGEDAVNYRL